MICSLKNLKPVNNDTILNICGSITNVKPLFGCYSVVMTIFRNSFCTYKEYFENALNSCYAFVLSM